MNRNYSNIGIHSYPWLHRDFKFHKHLEKVYVRFVDQIVIRYAVKSCPEPYHEKCPKLKTDYDDQWLYTYNADNGEYRGFLTTCRWHHHETKRRHPFFLQDALDFDKKIVLNPNLLEGADEDSYEFMIQHVRCDNRQPRDWLTNECKNCYHRQHQRCKHFTFEQLQKHYNLPSPPMHNDQ